MALGEFSMDSNFWIKQSSPQETRKFDLLEPNVEMELETTKDANITIGHEKYDTSLNEGKMKESLDNIPLWVIIVMAVKITITAVQNRIFIPFNEVEFYSELTNSGASKKIPDDREHTRSFFKNIKHNYHV